MKTAKNKFKTLIRFVRARLVLALFYFIDLSECKMLRVTTRNFCF